MEELTWHEGRSWHPESFTTLNGAEQNKQKNEVLSERVQLTVKSKMVYSVLETHSRAESHKFYNGFNSREGKHTVYHPPKV